MLSSPYELKSSLTCLQSHDLRANNQCMLNRNRFRRQASVDILQILDLGGKDTLIHRWNLEQASDPVRHKPKDFHKRFVAASTFPWKKKNHHIFPQRQNRPRNHSFLRWLAGKTRREWFQKKVCHVNRGRTGPKRQLTSSLSSLRST